MNLRASLFQLSYLLSPGTFVPEVRHEQTQVDIRRNGRWHTAPTRGVMLIPFCTDGKSVSSQNIPLRWVRPTRRGCLVLCRPPCEDVDKRQPNLREEPALSLIRLHDAEANPRRVMRLVSFRTRPRGREPHNEGHEHRNEPGKSHDERVQHQQNHDEYSL